MSKKLKVLIAPLDWGLGHATRCIPIIRALIVLGHTVVIATDRDPMRLLKQEFPELDFFPLPGYDVRYAKKWLKLKMVLNIPKILLRIGDEGKILEKIVAENKVDFVISDNRFGLTSSKVPNVFITHQVEIQTPVFQKAMNQLNRKYINEFDECWIPDYSGDNNLSGKLSASEALKNRVKFIGPLSRFSYKNKECKSIYKCMAIVSGPEPQRTIFEKLVYQELKELSGKSLLVRGILDENEPVKGGNVTIVSHLGSEEMQHAIEQSDYIISRSGYSTIMDLTTLKKKAILVPTEGQTEQEYLADYHDGRENFICVSQSKRFELKMFLDSKKRIY